jgi:surfactin synthase thioesterase subunit
VRRADILTENFRATTMDNLGFPMMRCRGGRDSDARESDQDKWLR